MHCDEVIVKIKSSINDNAHSIRSFNVATVLNILFTRKFNYFFVLDIVEDILADLSPLDDKEQPNIFNFTSQKSFEKVENEDLWSPKKISPYVLVNSDEAYYSQPSYPSTKASETFTMVIPSIRVLLEVETKVRIPVLMLKSSVELTMHDWSKQMHSKCEINLQASYFNEKVDTWEPLIEPIVCEENVYRPWEIIIKVFHV